MYFVKIYMKSGNVVEFPTDNLEWKYEGEKIISLSWNKLKEELDILQFISVDQIEAIVRVGANDQIRFKAKIYRASCQ